MPVLRPELFNRLERWRGAGRVKIIWPNREISWEVIYENGKARRNIESAKGHHWGETYRICCPFCNDTEYKLYICHRWGLKDEITNGLNLHLANCFRPDRCLTYENRLKMYNLLFSDYLSPVKSDLVLPGKKVIISGNGEVKWPGAIWTVDRLPADHKAVTYLKNRKFSSKWLGRYMNVGYVIQGNSENPKIADRLFIPAYQNDKLVAWQARILDDSLITPTNPKYRTTPNVQRGQILYNFDNAKHCKYVVVCEGPTDVWRYGPEAVAVLGQPCASQAEMLKQLNRPVIILLDPDAAKNSQHLFRLMRNSGIPVAEISLPDNRDPADFQTQELRKIVLESSRNQGIEI